MSGNIRDLVLFYVVMDSRLQGCDLVGLSVTDLVQEDCVRERVSYSTQDKTSYSIRANPKHKRYGWRMDYVIKNDHVPFHVS